MYQDFFRIKDSMIDNSLLTIKEILKLACVKYNAVVIKIKDEKKTDFNKPSTNQYDHKTNIFFLFSVMKIH